MTTTTAPTAGTIVEIDNCGSFSFAVVASREEVAYLFNPEFADRVWVRYDNGCVVPVPEYLVRPLTADQVVAKLNTRA